MNGARLQGEIRIPAGDSAIAADIVAPDDPRGLVLFAHGSGSSRLSPRNRYVARILQGAGFATVLADLLTQEEEQVDIRSGAFRFEIGFLARRLGELTDWIHTEAGYNDLAIGYFGASTGAAAALIAAAYHPQRVRAVVSRGGRPDLAGPALRQVAAPVLLIVGGRDTTVLKLNREALDLLGGEKRLAVVPGATHLFEEPGALDEVAALVRNWFDDHLPEPAADLI